MNNDRQAPIHNGETAFNAIRFILKRCGAAIEEFPHEAYSDNAYKASLGSINYYCCCFHIRNNCVVKMKIYAELETGNYRKELREYLHYLDYFSQSGTVSLLGNTICLFPSYDLEKAYTNGCSYEEIAHILASNTAKIKRSLPVCNAIISGGDIPDRDAEMTEVYRNIFLPAQRSLVPVEETDARGRRILKHVFGRGSRFAVPDGIYKITQNAFSELSGQLHRLYIPESVKIIDCNTFSDYRNPSNEFDADRYLIIECEADKKPDGFYFDTYSYLVYDDDDLIEGVDPPGELIRSEISSWLGSFTFRICEPEFAEKDLSGVTCDSFPDHFPEVRWSCRHPSWEEQNK